MSAALGAAIGLVGWGVTAFVTVFAAWMLVVGVMSGTNPSGYLPWNGSAVADSLWLGVYAGGLCAALGAVSGAVMGVCVGRPDVRVIVRYCGGLLGAFIPVTDDTLDLCASACVRGAIHLGFVLLTAGLPAWAVIAELRQPRPNEGKAIMISGAALVMGTIFGLLSAFNYRDALANRPALTRVQSTVPPRDEGPK